MQQQYTINEVPSQRQTFVDRRLRSSCPRPFGWAHKGRHRGNGQRDGAAVEHDDDGRHAWPEAWVLLHAEQPDVDAPQHLLRAQPIGWAALEQLRHVLMAPLAPNLLVPHAIGIEYNSVICFLDVVSTRETRLEKI
ncbi:unnamed protein product [Miscanthus lutarioriparius]|uniref:Uncharacterized protein n=1 Tax=Miscanthus lutarioriparius TaxID=422564 RepID=A0A811SGA7_9POAL|nr:unnamed protein product [Miscanthus lutarioriparius]